MQFLEILGTFESKALATIEANIVKTVEGEFVAAGGHQFRTFWTRDFCYSVPGLLLAGKADIVEQQLGLLWKMARKKDFLLPRGIDCVNPKTRVLANTVLPFLLPFMEYREKKLKAEYLSEHGVPSIDSNLLVLRAALQWSEFSGKPIPFPQTEIERGLAWYESFWRGGWIAQPPFSDWQDSVARKGPVLLTQLLYLDLRMRLERAESFPLGLLEKQLKDDFFSEKDGLFWEELGVNRLSLDSYAILFGETKIFSGLNRKAIYGKLKGTPLWSEGGVPGLPVYPKYSAAQISYTNRIVGLRKYHDGFHWGWLGAEAAKIAWHVGDIAEGDRIAMEYWIASQNEPYFSEVYESKQGQLTPVRRALYASECPFTWSGAKWIEALDARRCATRVSS